MEFERSVDVSEGGEWEALRAAYLDRFGSLAHVQPIVLSTTHLDQPPREDDAGDTICYLLTFTIGEAPTSRLYATFGAARWTGGVELFIRSAVPSSSFQRCLVGLLGRVPKVGRAQECECLQDELKAVMCLPLGRGSFLVRPQPQTTPRAVLQVVPLTNAEAERSRVDVRGLVSELEKIGALDAMDPLRACTLSPDAVPHWTAARLDAFIAAQRLVRKHLARHREMTAGAAPSATIQRERARLEEAIDLVRYFELRAAELGPEEALATDHLFVLDDFIHDLIAQIADLVPRWLQEEARFVLRFVFATHPRAMPLLEEVFGLPAYSHAAMSGLLCERMQRLVANATELEAEEISAAIRRGSRGYANQTGGGRSAFNAEQLWFTFATELFSVLRDDPGDIGRRRRAIARGAALTSIRRLFLVDDPGCAPQVRLVDAGRALVMDMYLGTRGQMGRFAGTMTGRLSKPN